MTDAPIEQSGGADVAPSPVETAEAGLATLSANKEWQADWSGENGRPAQIAAVKLKSDVTRSGFNPEPDTTVALPEILSDAVNDPNATDATKAWVEGMTPGQSVEDYSFRWEGQSDMPIEDLQELNSVAAEAALAMGANPHHAQKTIEFIDQQLARTDMIPTGTNSEGVVEILNKRLGQNAAATVAAAKAACDLMPERSREWLFASMDKLDTNAFAYVISRLAATSRANAPRS